MIHKFVANDNKGNVNILEVTSTGTKLGKVAPPVEDTDVATKKYVDDNAGGGERTVIPVTFEWSVETQSYLPTTYVPADVNSHPEKYDLLCTFSGGGKYDYATTMFRYGSNYVNIPVFFGIMDFEVPSSFAVSVPEPDIGAEDAEANFVGRFSLMAEKFIVTLTPTALDYSGTMDKTVAEINAAYGAGQEIWFRVNVSASSYYETPLSRFARSENGGYGGFQAFIIVDDSIIHAFTSPTYDGTLQTYSTLIYHLAEEKFIVTLTPTSPDYSGTMDKTVAEINAAYEAGQQIWFKLEASGMGYLMEMAGTGNADPESTYPSFNAKFLANNTLVYVGTGYTNDGTRQTYFTSVYPLTPAS